MAFVIPSIFTGVDRFSPVVGRMGSALTSFEQKLSIAQATSERSFRRHTNFFSKTSNQMFDYAKSAIAVGATIGGIAFSAKTLADYEDELANLRALTGATGSDFKKFESIIQSVAKSTKTSSIEVAKGFTTIANAMPQLLSDSEGLGQVTTASILLSKAARMELAPSASAVTDILNQFGKGAKDAAQLVDMLAAGSKYGSAEIRDLQAAIIGFGKVADIGGVNLRESIALTELVSQFKRGTDAGIELRNVLIEMNKNTAQDPKALADLRRLGVNISLVADKTKPLNERLQELKKIVGDNNALFHVFGKENIAMATTVLTNADRFGTLYENIGEAGVAAKMAAENTQTLYHALNELKAAWVNIVTASRGGNAALTVVGNTVRWLGRNLNWITNIVGAVAGAFAAWWAINKVIWAVRAAYTAWNFVLGVNAALQGRALMLVGLNTGVLSGYTAATTIASAATAAWNSTLLTTVGYIGAIAAGLMFINSKMDQWNQKTPLQKEIANKNKFMNTHSTPIYDRLAAKGYSPTQIDSIANSGYGKMLGGDNVALPDSPSANVGPTKASKSASSEYKKEVHVFEHKITLADSTGKTLAVINSSDLTPNISSTSQ